jgi:hypothetical protein
MPRILDANFRGNLFHDVKSILGLTYAMITGVAVSGVGSDDVAHPSEQASSADPQPRRDDQPQDAGQDAPVVELPDSGDDRTKNRCQSGISQRYSSPPFVSRTHGYAQGFPTLSSVAFPTRVRVGLGPRGPAGSEWSPGGRCGRSRGNRAMSGTVMPGPRDSACGPTRAGSWKILRASSWRFSWRFAE